MLCKAQRLRDVLIMFLLCLLCSWGSCRGRWCWCLAGNLLAHCGYWHCYALALVHITPMMDNHACSCQHMHGTQGRAELHWQVPQPTSNNPVEALNMHDWDDWEGITRLSWLLW